MMRNVNGYDVIEQLFESERTHVSRARRRSDGARVVLKFLNREYPTPTELALFVREYELTRSVAGEGVIRVMGLESYGHSQFMVLEDIGGLALRASIPPGGLPIDRFLHLATRTANALETIHSQRVIHKDINTTNIIWNPRTDALRVIDFGLATTLDRQDVEAQSAAALAGTLPFLAPEQTGRINRSIDERADLYSLGITFYELLTEHLPYQAKTAMEHVHAHIAREPIDPREYNERIPAMLVETILHLLKKRAEDRYQTAAGLVADLQRYSGMWRAGRGHESFQVGHADHPKRLRISPRLYGRDRELGQLETAFGRCLTGTPGVMLITGEEGVGKSSLVREFDAHLASLGGSMLLGKFDEHTPETPYSALIAAFSTILDNILAADDSALDEQRKRLRTALGQNAQVLVPLIPQLELLIDPPGSAPELPPDEARQRLHAGFQAFIGAMCRPGKPLVLHLDDLQWADEASLRLIESLLSNGPVPQLLLLASARHTQQTARGSAPESIQTHPLADVLARLHRQASERGDCLDLDVEYIQLAPLTAEDTAQLLSASLRVSVPHARRLALVVHQKTAGNPYFIHYFLTRLVDDGLLRNEALENGGRRWHWDIEQISEAELTDNVVESMLASIRDLPVHTQWAMGAAACIGYHFDLETIAGLLEQPEHKAFRALRPALDHHLLAALSELEAVFDHGNGDHGPGLSDSAALVVRRLRFQHDRVRDAAYQLLGDAERVTLHLHLAHLMEDQRHRPGDESGLFDIVRNLNAARSKLESAKQRLDLARYNLEAGQLALNRDAPEPAWRFLSTGLQVLPSTAWSEDHETAFELHRVGARAAYTLNHDERAHKLLATAEHKARSPLERASLAVLTIPQHTLRGDHEQALTLGRRALARLGVELPTGEALRAALADESSLVYALFDERDPETLLAQPELTDPSLRTTLQLLAHLQVPAFLSGHEWWQLATLMMSRISLRHGHTVDSSCAYAALGLLRNRSTDEFRESHKLGAFAMQLAARYDSHSHRARVGNFVANFLHPWVAHVRAGRAMNNAALESALGAGDSLIAGYIRVHQAYNEFYAGSPLVDVLEGQSTALQSPDQRFDMWARDALTALGLALAPLRQLTGAESPELHPSAHSDSLREWHERGSRGAASYLRVLISFSLCVYGRFDQAAEVAAEAATDLDAIDGRIPAAEWLFVSALARAGRLSGSPNGHRPADNSEIEYIENALVRYSVWATSCPANFTCRQELIAAELARITDDPLGAMNHYDRALEAAREHRFLHIECLINERIAAFWTERRKLKIARIYLTDAFHGYRLWGATGKEAQLLAAHSDLQSTGAAHGAAPVGIGHLATTSPSRDSSGANHNFDIQTVLGATQVLAREIILERLIEVLLRMVIESAGARRGALLLKEHGHWYFQAEAALDRSQMVRLFTDRPLAENDNLAVSVIRYAVRTGEPVLLGDAVRDPRFAQDPYILRYNPRSLLCMPLTRASEVIGILYLENELTGDVFTPERVELLHLLSVQMVVSVENARLYQQAQSEIEERRRTEKALQRARDEAEAANHAKTTFLSNTSHELRTPLNAILGYAELLLADANDRGDDDLVGDLGEIRQAGRHLARLISDVLDLSRTEDGTVELDLQGFELDELFGQLRADARAMVTRSDNRLTVETEASLGRAHTDREKLARVVMKVLDNAVKFTKSGTITMRAWREYRRERPRDWLHVAISDTGIGIAHDQLARIFEAFTQADSSPSRRYQGTGLGLTIVKRFCDLLCGHVDVESEQGKGTTVTLSVPMIHPRASFPLVTAERTISATRSLGK